VLRSTSPCVCVCVCVKVVVRRVVDVKMARRAPVDVRHHSDVIRLLLLLLLQLVSLCINEVSCQGSERSSFAVILTRCMHDEYNEVSLIETICHFNITMLISFDRPYIVIYVHFKSGNISGRSVDEGSQGRFCQWMIGVDDVADCVLN